MTRMSKQNERRAVSRRKHRAPSPKSGTKKDNLPKGFREHPNAVDGDLASSVFVGKVRSI